MSLLLLTSGTPFTYTLHLENRSYYRRLLVLPKIEIGGNVTGGIIQDPSDPISPDPPAAADPTQVIPNEIIELNPRQVKDFTVVFWSVRADAINTAAATPTSGGGTRGTVQFLLASTLPAPAEGLVKLHQALILVAPSLGES